MHLSGFAGGDRNQHNQPNGVGQHKVRCLVFVLFLTAVIICDICNPAAFSTANYSNFWSAATVHAALIMYPPDLCSEQMKVTWEDKHGLLEQMDGIGLYALIYILYWPMGHKLISDHLVMESKSLRQHDHSCRLMDAGIHSFTTISFICFVHETHSHEAVQ